MFNDFLNINYWKTKNKLKLLRDLINRIDASGIERKIKSLSQSIDRFDNAVQNYSLPIPISEGEEPIPEDLPDLIISSIIPEEHDHYVNFAITVENIGTHSANSNILNVVIPNVSNVNLTVPYLDVGQSVTLYHQYSFDPESEDEEQKSIIATADAYNTVLESDENNNTRSVQATVKSQYIPTPGNGYLIVHIHNPEGKEIGSIIGDSDISLSHGIIATNEATHGIPTAISSGNYTVITSFNGINLEKNIDILEGETKEIFFVFPRTEKELDFSGSNKYNFSRGFSKTFLHGGYGGSYLEGRYPADTQVLWHFHQAYAQGSDIIYVNVSTLAEFQASFSLDSSSLNTSLNADLDVTISNVGIVFPPFDGVSGDYFSEVDFYFRFQVVQLLIPFYIPSQSSFNFWYVQQITNDGYAYGSIIDITDISRYIFKAEPCNQYKILPTSVAYKEFSFKIPPLAGIGNIYHSGSYPTLYEGDSYSVPHQQGQKTNSFSDTILRMSSVPYDLDGTAV